MFRDPKSFAGLVGLLSFASVIIGVWLLNPYLITSGFVGAIVCFRMSGTDIK